MSSTVPSTTISLKKAFSFSAIESIGSRLFDFIALWIVLNTLPIEDLAKFGVATASIFFFNLIFFAPETALFKYFNDWKDNNVLAEYLSSFYQFSYLKIAIHYILVLIVWIYSGSNWLFYAITFSIITQNIQLAEISRIYLRLSLQQNKVAKFELISKIVLCLACITLYFFNSIETYFIIYLLWSILTSIYWLKFIRKEIKIKLVPLKIMGGNILKSSIGFSFWSHLSGVLTYFVYNGNLLFLEYYNTSIDDIALYTAVNKVANLFFVIPMFFQSFVPVVLSSDRGHENKFIKLICVCAFLSISQYIFFLLFGENLGAFFGVESNRINDFYYLGIILCSGILILNISRPLSTFLMIKQNAFSLMKVVFIPTSLIALCLYVTITKKYGVSGAAIATSISYLYMSISLSIIFFLHKKRVKNG
nr:hypothetical protein [Providencia rettgeri]